MTEKDTQCVSASILPSPYPLDSSSSMISLAQNCCLVMMASDQGPTPRIFGLFCSHARTFLCLNPQAHSCW